MKYTVMQFQRVQNGFNQEKAADKLGISRSYLSQIETYQVPAPHELLKKITELYCCEMQDLFQKSG